MISTLAKAFPKWAALLTALPLATFLSLIWIYTETRDLTLLEAYTQDVLIWTLPSVLFFIAAIFRARVSFPFALALSTTALFIGVLIFKRFHLLK